MSFGSPGIRHDGFARTRPASPDLARPHLVGVVGRGWVWLGAAGQTGLSACFSFASLQIILTCIPCSPRCGGASPTILRAMLYPHSGVQLDGAHAKRGPFEPPEALSNTDRQQKSSPKFRCQSVIQLCLNIRQNCGRICDLHVRQNYEATAAAFPPPPP